MAITPLPPAPSTSDPTNFASKADALIAALPQFVTEANALGTALFFVLANYLSGLTLSTAGSSATFGIATGQAADGANAAIMSLASAYTKTTGSWAVGSTLGALDTGAIANSTWYHVYLIQRVDTLVVDVLVSLSASAPTMPTNYTRKRRIGSMKTNGSAQWTKFVQVGDEFLWDTPVQDLASTTLSTTPANVTLTVPTGVQVLARLRGGMTNASAAVSVLVNSPDEASGGLTGGNLNAQSPTAGGGAAFAVDVRTNTSAQVRTVASAASTTLNLATYGWRDDRGRSG